MNCPHCNSTADTWFDRSIAYDSDGTPLEYEEFATRCCDCGKNVDAPKSYYEEDQMNKESTQDTDNSLPQLLRSLDEYIEDALENSNPIGLTLCRARMTITDQYDRICEFGNALDVVLDVVRGERDEAQYQGDVFLKTLGECQERCINAERESQEQARLLGMSAQREARLLAQLAAERALADRLAGILQLYYANDTIAHHAGITDAIIAWKEARND